MRIVLVTSPRLGRARAARIERAIAGALCGTRRREAGYGGCAPCAVLVAGAGSAADAGSAAGADLHATDLVIAAGGDGTIRSLLGAAVTHRVPLGIVPCGRGNDLARALGIGRCVSHAVETIREGRSAAIDLVSVNGALFATAGGLGLVAEVSGAADRWGRGPAARLATLTYPIATAARVLAGWTPITARVSTDGRPGGTARLAALVVCNQPCLGGWFAPCPGASNADGAVDLCAIASPASRVRMLEICAWILAGHGTSCPEVTLHRARRAVIDTEEDAVFFGDGEPLALGRRFEIAVLPGALRVFVPCGSRALEARHAR